MKVAGAVSRGAPGEAFQGSPGFSPAPARMPNQLMSQRLERSPATVRNLRATRQAMVTSRVLRVAGGLMLLLSGTAGAQNRIVANPHGELSVTCNVCHSPEGWTPAHVSAAFDHGKAAGFALVGAHASASCRACHATLDFRGTSRNCVSCHVDPHRGEVGNDCARCHSARNFLDRSAMSRAHQLTRFPLQGTHLTVDCEACHTAPQGRLRFVALATECSTCHLKDYQAARDPDHATAGYSTDCQQCHAAITWLRTTMDHAATGFALTGAHLRITCSRCHGVGQFQSLPSACVACHQADYDATTDPGHRAAGFPTDCIACHTTSRWSGARFDHDKLYFPIYTGRHQGRWSFCSDCHINANDYHQFDCVHCHQNAHQGRGYTSQQCYSCHPTGNGGD